MIDNILYMPNSDEFNKASELYYVISKAILKAKQISISQRHYIINTYRYYIPFYRRRLKEIDYMINELDELDYQLFKILFDKDYFLQLPIQ